MLPVRIFEAKFVIFGLFKLLWLFLACCDLFNLHVGLADDFVRFRDTGRYLHTVFGHRMINFCCKLCSGIL